MPISRTVSGLKIEYACDDYVSEGWLPYSDGGHIESNDTSDKKEGAASIKIHGEQSYYPSGTTYFYFELTTGVLLTPGWRVHIWHKASPGSGCTLNWAFQYMARLGVPPWNEYHDLFTKAGSEAWTMKAGDVPADASPYYSYIKSKHLASGSYTKSFDAWIDHFVVSTTRHLTVSGLTPGQKVKLHRSSDNSLLDTQTCAGGATSVTFDIDAEDYPLYLYMKIYATDGATLIETTPSYRMCGGDTWAWTAPVGTLDIDSTAFVIHRTASSGTPKSADITATLTTPGGAPYPGVTIYFTTSRGTVSPASDVTDANGQAQTTLTSNTHGIAVVKANWPGDASVPAAVGFRTHHVFYDEESGDSEKKFQLFVEGYPLSYSEGSYSLAQTGEPQEWLVRIKEWDENITKRGLVSIYRKGVLEFSGILLVPTRPMNDNPRITIGGIDSKGLLLDRVVTLKDYSAKTLSYIASDLLTSYQCGISLGGLGDYPVPFSITFADQYLLDSVVHLCDVIGWLYRINADRTLDIKPSLGATKAVEFGQGVNLFGADHMENLTQVCNALRMRGNEDLVSTQTDSSSIDEIGVVDGVAFEKSITVQDTLDLAAVSELDRRVSGAVQITGYVKDTYDVGSWGPDDWVTITAAENELSGLYKVVKITRDMKDPNYAYVEFQNAAAVKLADIIDKIKRQLKDLSAKTAI
jgi:hypothetical protein